MVTNSVFLQEEIEKERGVILAEMKASMDSVEDLSFKRVNEIAFGKSCLRYDVAGTEKNVKKFTRKDLISYYEKHYIPNNTLITMVSSLEHEEALEKIKENFGHWQSKELVAVEIFDEQNKAIRKTTYKKRKIEIGERDLDIMKKVHKTAVISTLDDSSELCSYILNQSIEDEDIYEFLHDMERINNITSDEIYEVANKVLKNPTIHILKS